MRIQAKFLEDEDHHLAAWERNPNRPRLTLLICVSFGIALAVTAPDAIKRLQSGEKGWWVAHAVIIPIMVGLWFLFGPIGNRRRLRRAARKIVNNPPTETWLEFTEDGFMTTGRGGKSAFHPWSSLPRALKMVDGIMVYFEDHEFAFYWIPQSAFASTADYQCVLDLAARKIARFETRKS